LYLDTVRLLLVQILAVLSVCSKCAPKVGDEKENF